ncbi:MAG TPA: ABC transporter six-transmembrane domain-containing protein [Candidatus Kapabacteria bacterium]|nr:ABC transporter six-transmembrane domain-containing protein [Candidatus Kapabacteria bacterium]
MIRRLYQQYRLQIIFAFALVVFENFAEIAEPYVFGKAIDGLREANRIEEEVDSSMTNIQLRQFADSVRGHLLDSLRIVDSVRSVDSVRAVDSMESFYGSHPTDRPNGAANFDAPIVHLALFVTGKRHKSYEPDSLRSLLPPEGTPERAHIDSVRRKLARLDSIRSRRRRMFHHLTRSAERDSIRKALMAHKNPGPGKPAGTSPPPKQSEPLGSYITRDIGLFLPPLIPWVLLFFINSGFGGFRRIYDTRIYTKMFASLSSDVVARQLAQGEDLSKVAARSSMAWNNIEFFQYNVPEFLEQFIAVGGAVIALALFDWRLSAVGGVLIVLVLFGSKYYMRLLENIQVTLHDRYEDEYNVFSTREPVKIRSYYDEIADLEIRYSQRSTLSYGVVRVFLLIMFLSTLYISIDLDRFTIGALYSIVAYVWSFVTATEYIPYLSEKWVELRDASRRITEPLPTD